MTAKPIRVALAGLLALLVAACAWGQSPDPKPADLSKPTLYCVSTAHLDTQWRWTIQDTIREYIPNTLRRNFANFERSPDYVFSFEGAFRYRMAKEYYPADYARMKQYIAQNRWRVCGSAYDAGDVNIPSPEALMRQTLYGNGFWREEFGKTSVDIFLPDCFGFGYALPSIAAHCGLKGFSTQKLTWGSATGIPFDIGRWEGPDGASIVGALNAGDYTARLREDLSRSPGWLGRANRLGEKSGVYAAYRYYGVGDQGGATDPESVTWLDKSIAGTGPVKVIPAGADQLYRDLSPKQVAALPSYKGELIMTTHGTGCYTSQSAMKRWNRKNELLADAAERASVAADLLGGAPYPKAKLREAWERFLWHQFHDDLTGTSIPQAYVFSWNDEAIAQNQFAEVLANAGGAVSRALDTSGEGVAIVVMNPLGLEREDVVSAQVRFPVRAPASVQVTGPDGRPVPAQVVNRDVATADILFLAKTPSVGFGVYQVRPARRVAAPDTGLRVSQKGLENAQYRVQLDDNGDVASVFDKTQRKELLAAPLRLALLKDTSTGYPAWEMRYQDVSADPVAYADSPVDVRVIESGPARVAVRITRYVGDSTLIQDVRLAAGSAGDRLEFDTRIGWRTKGVMLKLVAPLAAANPNATYDLGLGTIERPNDAPRRYEVPAQQWADITTPDGSTGAAILNDCRYGWDKPTDNTLRLTLLRTPKTGGGFAEQSSADLGRHRILYALTGHAGDWRKGEVPAQAMRLNQPLIAFQAPAHGGALGRSLSLLRVSSPQVAVRAFKRAEQGNEVIVRLQELTGKPAAGITLAAGASIVAARELDGQEQPKGTLTPRDGKLRLDLTAYQPRTVGLTLAPFGAKVSAPVSKPVALPFDTCVTSADGEKVTGGLDGDGHAIPSELWPGTITAEGLSFKLGSAATGAKNAVVCKGQTLPLRRDGLNSLYLLAASAKGDVDATFAVGAKPVVLHVQDCAGNIGQWDSRLVNGKQVSNYSQLAPAFVKRAPVAWIATHRHNRDGGNDLYLFHYLFKYRLDLPAGVSAITLPNDPNVRILAASLANNPNDDTRPATELVDMPVALQDLPMRVATDNTPFRDADNPGATVPGLSATYYEGDFKSVGDLLQAQAAKAATSANIDLSVRGREDFFGLKFEGYVEVPKDGVYTFYLSSDDGSALFIGDRKVVDNDGLHGDGEASGAIKLRAGKHALRVLYFQGPTDKALSADWEGPGVDRQRIPDGALSHRGQ